MHSYNSSCDDFNIAICKSKDFDDLDNILFHLYDNNLFTDNFMRPLKEKMVVVSKNIIGDKIKKVEELREDIKTSYMSPEDKERCLSDLDKQVNKFLKSFYDDEE